MTQQLDGPVDHGWLADLTIRDVVGEHRDVFSLLPLVLIASIDSERQVAEMPWARQRIARDRTWALSTEPLVIAGSSIAELADEWATLSNGFDEIWIPKDARVAVPPASSSLVAPRTLEASLPSAISQWMAESGCVLGLGDGEGLNFVTSDPELCAELGLSTSG
jgi:hypothetical protein